MQIRHLSVFDGQADRIDVAQPPGKDSFADLQSPRHAMQQQHGGAHRASVERSLGLTPVMNDGNDSL